MLNKMTLFSVFQKKNKMLFPDYSNVLATVSLTQSDSYTVSEDCFAAITLINSTRNVSSYQLQVNNIEVFNGNSENQSEYTCIFLKKNDIISCNGLYTSMYIKIFALRD